MKFIQFYITNKDGKSNCEVRSFCKLLNKEYENILCELCNIKEELNCQSYNDIEVFETFMSNHNINSIEYGKNIKIKDLKLKKGSYIVFCWDKNQSYHMVTIIDNILYDKDDRSMDLYAIMIYKQE